MFRIELSLSAHRQVLRLPAETRERINRAISRLTQDPRPPGCKKLTAREGYRIRAGDYRILYTIIDDGEKVVTVYRVMARDDVYRK